MTALISSSLYPAPSVLNRIKRFCRAPLTEVYGIETAQRLRAADPDLLIVFVTSSPEYVWDAFPVHPFDYLLKPYKEEKFEQLAGELRRVLCRQQPELEVRIARQIVRLPLTKIYYATAQNHYVRVVTDDGECRATANFAQVQEQLQTQPEFLVCNRGVIYKRKGRRGAYGSRKQNRLFLKLS